MCVTNGAACAVQLRHELRRGTIERDVPRPYRQSVETSRHHVNLPDQFLLDRW